MAKVISPSVLALREARAQVKALMVQVAAERAERKEQAAAKAEAKRAAAIAKAEARLQKLLSKQVGLVGIKAAKANRKAGAAKIIKA